MRTEPLSVYELREYWKRTEALAEGDGIDCIPLRLMPPWAELCSELNWKYHLVEGGYFPKKNYGFCGVYRLIALSVEGDLTKPSALNRVCGSDVSGTLYIGEAKSLNNRLNQLRRSTGPRERSHGSVGMLRRIPALNLPASKLGIGLLFTGCDTKFFERQLIEAYMNSFGDTPPLNYRL